MSSTKRGAQRHLDDFYETPAWATHAILPLVRLGVSCLDPCAGAGAIMRAVDEHAKDAVSYGLEIDAQRAAAAGEACELRDSLSEDAWPDCDSIVTNPPFALALEFIDRALTECKGDVAMLLRLNFLGSQRRAVWHRAHPSDVLILPRRPSFTIDGKTDSCEYAWFLWGPGRGGRWAILNA